MWVIVLIMIMLLFVVCSIDLYLMNVFVGSFGLDEFGIVLIKLLIMFIDLNVLLMLMLGGGNIIDLMFKVDVVVVFGGNFV